MATPFGCHTDRFDEREIDIKPPPGAHNIDEFTSLFTEVIRKTCRPVYNVKYGFGSIADRFEKVKIVKFCLRFIILGT